MLSSCGSDNNEKVCFFEAEAMYFSYRKYSDTDTEQNILSSSVNKVIVLSALDDLEKC